MVHMLDQAELARTLFPVGESDQGRGAGRAAALGLRTAAKPDSQDVCFITRRRRPARASSRRRITLHPARVVDTRRHRGRRGAGRRAGHGRPAQGPRAAPAAAEAVRRRRRPCRRRPSSSATTPTCCRRRRACRRAVVGRRPGRPATCSCSASAHGRPRRRASQPDGDGVVVDGPSRTVASPRARASSSTTSPTAGSSAAASPTPDARVS